MLWSNLIRLDEEITSVFRMKDPKNPVKPLAVFFAHSGDSWFILLALLIIWFLTKGDWHHLSAVMASGSIALAVLVLVIKFSIRRRRPEGDWGAIYRNTDPHSFPSGHAARTAMLALLALLLGPLWFGLILVIWAPLVSLARVWLGVHYFSDVFAGIVLGVAFGFGIFGLAPALTRLIPFLF